MNVRMYPLLLMVLLLMLSGCKSVHKLPMETTSLSPNGEVAQLVLTSDSEKGTPDTDEFQTFIETWKLAGLIPEGLVMTDENRNTFIRYFQNFDDDVTLDYTMLLLQSISAGEPTPTEQYNDYKYGVYLKHCMYCLYDMNMDGFPELILKTGDCEAAYMYTVYTVIDGKLTTCGELSGSHAGLYSNGSGGFVRYAGHMGIYDISVTTLEGTTLITQKITDGELDYSKNEDYPELNDYGYGDYDQYLEFNSIPTLFLAVAG